MSNVEGNAWAQMKARESDQQSADLGNVTEYADSLAPSKPTRTFSGLDYDAELALPMPKPHHQPPPSDDAVATMTTATPSPSTPRSNVVREPNVTKKRSTTEPTHPVEANTSGSKPGNEKKKSKVATLRSKFSLKDIGKDFRGEAPALSSMPKLQGNEQANYSLGAENSQSQSESHSFDEQRLYVPKTRPEGIYPASAPLYPPSTFRESSSLDGGSRDNDVSITPTTTDSESDKTVKHIPIQHTDPGPSPADIRLETLLLDSSSPAPRTGECNKSHPETIQVKSRVCSMKVEDGCSMLPPPLEIPQPVTSRPVDLSNYSPSIYGTPKMLPANTSDLSFSNLKAERQHPLIVSSNNKREVLYEDPERKILNSVPTDPPFLPPKARGREGRQPHPPIQIHENRFFAGVTSHGGYAPPPPHPDYQNTVTLEQQLATHVDSIHYHINTAMHKLSRTFENSNNWAMDQIMRHVDSISDLARLINSRTVTQTEVVKEMQRLMIDTQAQLTTVQGETRQTEEKLRGFVHHEIGKLRVELGGLQPSPSALVQQDPKSSRNESQGTHSLAKHPKIGGDSNNNKRVPNKRRPQTVKKEEIRMTRNTDHKTLTQSAQDNELSPQKSLDERIADMDTKDQDQILNIATPTAAFPTPQADNDEIFTGPKLHTKKIPPIFKSNPSKESSGSPEPKATKLQTVIAHTQLPAVEDRRGQEQQHRESENIPITTINHDEAKTPQKKGSVFSFRRKRNGDNPSTANRFLRTPRRSKERKPTSEQSPLLPSKDLPLITRTTPSSSPSHPDISTTSTAVTSRIPREPNPSMIHPALRNPHQRQMMLERETGGTATVGKRTPSRQSQGQFNTLRFSQSHQNFRSTAAAPSGNNQLTPHSSPPAIAHTWHQPPQFPLPYNHRPPFFTHSPATSSSSSLRTLTQRQVTIHYPSSPPSVFGLQPAQSYAAIPPEPGVWVPTRPPPPTPTPVPVHGQFEMNTGWYRDSYGYGGNGSTGVGDSEEQKTCSGMI